MLKKLFLSISLIALGAVCQAQEKQAEPRYTVGANTAACELNARNLDELSVELGNNPMSNVKVEFYAGAGETEAVNSMRMSRFQQYLANYKRIAPDRVTVVNGGKVEGNGQVKFFIVKPPTDVNAEKFDEELFMLVYAMKNKSLCMNCCEVEDMPKNLAPVKKSKAKPKSKKKVYRKKSK